jgi:hypothetical protein
MPELKKGTKVKVYSASLGDYLGIGEITEYEELCGDDWVATTPKIKIGKKIYRGYECWWIELSEAKRLEKSLEAKINA